MPWGTQWSGNGIVTASAVQVIDGGVVVASITPQGNISGQIISANTDIILAGQSLLQILNDLPQGIIAQTNVASAHLPTAAVGGTESVLMELDVTLAAGRCYQFFLSNMVAQSSGPSCRVTVRVRHTIDGTTPSTSSPRLFETYGDTPVSGNVFSVPNGQSRVIQPGSQKDVRLLVTSLNQLIDGGAAQTHQFIGLDSGGLGVAGPMLALVDLGNSVPDTGMYIGSGSSGTPSVRFKSFETVCIDSQSFQGNGNASAGSGQFNESFMYFGQDPAFSPNGVWRSYVWFNTADTSGGNGLGSIADMASASSVAYLDVFIYTDWWYFVAGGTLYVGHSGTGVTHSTEPVSHAYDETSATYTQRGQGKWISLLGTGIETAIVNNLGFEAIILGPPPGNSTNLQFYGYAAGGSDSVNNPKIRGGYYK